MEFVRETLCRGGIAQHRAAHFAQLLAENGFDCAEALEILEADDLEAVGLKARGHRKLCLRAVQQGLLPSTRSKGAGEATAPSVVLAPAQKTESRKHERMRKVVSAADVSSVFQLPAPSDPNGSGSAQCTRRFQRSRAHPTLGEPGVSVRPARVLAPVLRHNDSSDDDPSPPGTPQVGLAVGEICSLSNADASPNDNDDQPRVRGRPAARVMEQTARPRTSRFADPPHGVEAPQADADDEGQGRDDGDFPSIVQLNVGGHLYTTRLATLRRRDGMLASMFSGRHRADRDKGGCYFIDRDGTHFRHILNFLRDGSVPSSSEVPVDELHREAQFYQLEELEQFLAQRYPGVLAAYEVRDSVAYSLGQDLVSVEATMAARAVTLAQQRCVLQVMVLLMPSECPNGHEQPVSTATVPRDSETRALGAADDAVVLPTRLLVGDERTRSTIRSLLEARLRQQGHDVHACGQDEPCAHLHCSDRACRRTLRSVGFVFRFASTEAAPPSVGDSLHAIHDLLRRATTASSGTVRCHS